MMVNDGTDASSETHSSEIEKHITDRRAVRAGVVCRSGSLKLAHCTGSGDFARSCGALTFGELRANCPEVDCATPGYGVSRYRFENISIGLVSPRDEHTTKVSVR